LLVALVSAVTLALGAASTPAQACKGSTTLFKDDFKKVNRAWMRYWNNVEFDISDGKMLVKVPDGFVGAVMYQGKFFPEADACVEVVVPSVADTNNKWTGLTFVAGNNDLYFATVSFDGKVGLFQLTADGWLYPIPELNFEGVNQQPGSVNTIRLTWKGPPGRGSKAPEDTTVSFYVNDKLVDTVDVPTNGNRKIGIGFQTGGDSAEVRNMLITR
jgi:hypothetical protein